MGLLDQAQQAHSAHQAARTAKTVADGNVMLKSALQEAFAAACEPAGNRVVLDGVTFTCHTDGKLHVLHRCQKCGFEYLSFHHIRPGEHALVDLHHAATEPARSHPPCNGAKFVKPGAPEPLDIKAGVSTKGATS